MGLAIGDEHVELAGTVRRWVEARAIVGAARKALDAPSELLPDQWDELVGAGLGGPGGVRGERRAGLRRVRAVRRARGAGPGRAAGPFLATAIVATALDRWGAAIPTCSPGWLDGGARRAGPCRPTCASRTAIDLRYAPRLSGTARWLAGSSCRSPGPAPDGGWCVLGRGRPRGARARRASIATRRLAEVIDGGRGADRSRPPTGARGRSGAGGHAPGRRRGDWAWRTGASSTAADVCRRAGAVRPPDRTVPGGEAPVCRHAGHARDGACRRSGTRPRARRRRPELGPGRWTSPAALGARGRRSAAPRTASRCSVGIGYTWEHDAHLFLKRATAMRHLLDPPDRSAWRVAGATAAGERRRLAIDLASSCPPTTTRRPRTRPARPCRAFVAELRRHDKSEWRALLADSGLPDPALAGAVGSRRHARSSSS